MSNYLNDPNQEVRKNWSRLILGYSQLWGLLVGYTKQIKLEKKYEEKKLTIQDLLILQADGEVPELLRYFGYKGSSLKVLKNEIQVIEENFHLNHLILVLDLRHRHL